MMKVKVLKQFADRYTKEIRKSGETCEYEEKRARELMEGGYVEEAPKQGMQEKEASEKPLQKKKS